MMLALGFRDPDAGSRTPEAGSREPEAGSGRYVCLAVLLRSTPSWIRSPVKS